MLVNKVVNTSKTDISEPVLKQAESYVMVLKLFIVSLMAMLVNKVVNTSKTDISEPVLKQAESYVKVLK